MAKTFQKTSMHIDVPLHYCPGCTHGIVERLVAECIEELGIQDRTIAIPGVGCSGLSVAYYNVDAHNPSHGRALAVATGTKRALPDRIVFTYQGDGDLAGIGMCETVHAIARGEKLTTIFVNNMIYGMTGGQVSPTTLVGQKCTTAVNGRDPAVNGYPVHVSEMMSQLMGAYYVERVAVNNTKNILHAKKAIKKAFQNQMDGKGFNLIEVLATCPTNWHMTPCQAMDYIDQTSQFYPLGVYLDRDKNEGRARPE